MVSFPPLIDMLKFSGYPYLIRGQPFEDILNVMSGERSPRLPKRDFFITTLEVRLELPLFFRYVPEDESP